MSLIFYVSIVFITVFCTSAVIIHEAVRQTEKEYTQAWDEIEEKILKENIIFIENFDILTDCTEMTLQLTEKVFYNETFKNKAWDHYREMC